MRFMDILIEHPFELSQILVLTILAIANILTRKRMPNKTLFIGVLVGCFLGILKALLDLGK